MTDHAMPLILSKPSSGPSSLTDQTIRPMVPTVSAEPGRDLTALSIPAISLSAIPGTTDELAARLTSALLGHLLFLKGQIPLTVVHLTRKVHRERETGDEGSKAARKRAELVDALDDLAAHLPSTFAALSTAYARRPAHRKGERTRASVAFVFGGSALAAKARVMLVVDGLEVRVWGEREDPVHDQDEEVGHESIDGEEDEEEEETAEDGEQDGYDGSASATPPPASRTPSCSPSPLSSTLSENIYPRSAPRTPLTHPPSGPRSPLASLPIQPSSSTPLPDSDTAQEATLLAAERQLARVLASTNTPDTLVTELPPTRAHILLRAPRRFRHPAWSARQKDGAPLDAALAVITRDSGLDALDAGVDAIADVEGTSAPRKPPAKKKGIPCDGVYVSLAQEAVSSAPGRVDTSIDSADEEDELIWWGWDGSISGFADW